MHIGVTKRSIHRFVLDYILFLPQLVEARVNLNKNLNATRVPYTKILIRMSRNLKKLYLVRYLQICLVLVRYILLTEQTDCRLLSLYPKSASSLFGTVGSIKVKYKGTTICCPFINLL